MRAFTILPYGVMASTEGSNPFSLGSNPSGVTRQLRISSSRRERAPRSKFESWGCTNFKNIKQ